MFVQLTRGYKTQIDDADAAVLEGRRWSALTAAGGHLYAIGHAKDRSAVLMHRLITGAPKGKVVDHANGDGLDNRRINLRVCTQSQNLANRPRCRDGAVPYKGVTRAGKKFLAAIMCDGIRHRLGLFDTAELAADAYQTAAVRLRGEFAYQKVA